MSLHVFRLIIMRRAKRRKVFGKMEPRELKLSTNAKIVDVLGKKSNGHNRLRRQSKVLALAPVSACVDLRSLFHFFL